MKFEFMEDAVNDICDNLENNPDRFNITTYCLVDKKTGIEYWVSGGSRGCITQIWNGSSRDTVFSTEQGQRIAQAFSRMTETKANFAQQEILNKIRREARTSTDVVVVDVKFTRLQRIKNWWASL